ncbi:MAG: cytochrome c-type biogenesis protein CcmH [Rhodocyclaceae bacterium]|nr:cytochrome c-type biogenesis protein CcmH [Rhodocyclaceae bacterium]
MLAVTLMLAVPLLSGVAVAEDAAAPAGIPPGTDVVRLHEITADLRCLVCQNQSIADSHAGLAIDLRNQVIKLMGQGKSDAEIKQYMVDRYGEFVLYDPPFSISNGLLWVGPFLLVVIGVWVARRTIAARAAAAPAAALSAAEREALEARYRNATTDETS